MQEWDRARCQPSKDLVSSGQVAKIISPIPYSPGSGGAIEERWQAGRLDIEIVPQGVLVERLRAGGAGIGGVFLPTAVGTRFGADKEQRSFPQGEAVLELPLKADYSLIKVSAADTLGNAIYDGSGRNWAPVMAMAARITVAEAGRIVEPGELDPEAIISPGIFVNRLVLQPGEPDFPCGCKDTPCLARLDELTMARRAAAELSNLARSVALGAGLPVSKLAACVTT